LNSSPKVAIVILNWNGKKYLEQFLASVLSTRYSNFEVIIADNGSTDDSISFLQTNHPSLRLIRFTENLGFAKGYNEALKQVESDYYVLLNSDVEVTAGWLQPQVDLLESDITRVASQPKILSYTNKKCLSMPAPLVAGLTNMATRLPKEEYLMYVKRTMDNMISQNPSFGQVVRPF
jgi:GT2 family glycosyltransferase